MKKGVEESVRTIRKTRNGPETIAHEPLQPISWTAVMLVFSPGVGQGVNF